MTVYHNYDQERQHGVNNMRGILVGLVLSTAFFWAPLFAVISFAN